MTGEHAEIRGHRRVTRAGRIGSALTACALVLGALLLGGAIKARVPDTAREQEPFVRTGAVGTPVDARTFTVTVLGVRGGAILSADRQSHDTGGIWVLVSVRLAARHAPVSIGYAALRDARGRVYRATDRVEQFLVTGGRTLQPGIPLTGEVAFEVPVRVATHLSLRLAASATDLRMDAVTDSPLPVDAAELGAWQAQKQPLVLAAPQVAP
jgi:hypothetical protein